MWSKITDQLLEHATKLLSITVTWQCLDEEAGTCRRDGSERFLAEEYSTWPIRGQTLIFNAQGDYAAISHKVGLRVRHTSSRCAGSRFDS